MENKAEPVNTAAEDSPQAIRAKIESILFCIPQGVSVDTLAKKINFPHETIKNSLIELQKDFEGRSGLKIVFEDNLWKFKVPDENIQIVKDVAEPEMDKSILETLAYIGWRGGSRQCDVVRVRSNKAYNHIKFLTEKGFIESSRSGLSKWLQPTKKFYEYFNMQQGQKLPVEEKQASAGVPADISDAMNTLFS